MVWSPALASRFLILKKRSDFFVGPFFHALNKFIYPNMLQLIR